MTITTTSIGKIGFALPYENEEAAIKYLTYTPGSDRPSKVREIPLANLRGEVEAAEPVPVASQLFERGYAVAHHDSAFHTEVGSEEGIAAYLTETAE